MRRLHALLCFAISLCPNLGQGQENSRPSVVRVSATAGGDFELERNGKPLTIKGAGGQKSLKLLADIGGNSIRTWGTEGLDAVLDEAHKHGLAVAVGIWLGHERHGFNYNDADQVAAQLESVRKAVLRFKDHPAVLLWGLGNEMEGFGKGDNAAIWSAVNNIAAMVKKLDPNHPTMTVVAEIGGERVKNLHRLCPSIDIVGINTYAGAATVPSRYRDAGGVKPFILTEFGPPGPWESAKNADGAVLELSSDDKALSYRKAYLGSITVGKGRCLGSYAFVWGSKQEKTATWFGMLLPDGSRLAACDVMQELWTGKAPANRCPRIGSLRIEGADRVKPGAEVNVKLAADDLEKDALTIEYVLQAEGLDGQGGDAEAAPPTYPEAIQVKDASGVKLKMPASGGIFRLFAYVRDGKGGAAVANVPIFVVGPRLIQPARKATLPLVVYDEADEKNAPFAASGWMGNVKAMRLALDHADDPKEGKTCLRLEFNATEGWGGIAWQNPPGDWGQRPGGWDLTGAKKLSFWARGAEGGEQVTFEFGIIGKDKPYHDSAKGRLEKVKLTKEWQAYSIDVAGKDLSRIKTGFVVAVPSASRPIVLFLDRIRYE